jgi:protein-export membrane protein SecD
MFKKRLLALVLLVLGGLVGWYVYNSQVAADSTHKFKLGLDLNGGTELVYSADTSKLASSEISDAMNTLRDVIERRVNAFGVAEPIVQVEKVGFGIAGDASNQLVVDLPGVTNVKDAVAMIGKTPSLEFRLENPALTDKEKADPELTANKAFITTGLDGRYLSKSALEYDQTTGQSVVSLQFNTEGADKFAELTKNNIGKVLAIFLDGDLKSMPVIRDEIRNGKAVISGGFTGSAGRAEAKTLVNNLNLGALPLPIELISTQTVGATLGQAATKAAVYAGILAFILISIFMILFYRLPGLIAVIALAIYTAINLAIFKLLPVTLTAPGIAGFILSVGMAVDANILIFERMKEEMNRGRELGDAVKEGFHRAWLSIRDSNTSSLITACILFMFSSTALVKGFALVFAIGVLVSMFTAITATRTMLLSIKSEHAGKVLKFLFGGKTK